MIIVSHYIRVTQSFLVFFLAWNYFSELQNVLQNPTLCFWLSAHPLLQPQHSQQSTISLQSGSYCSGAVSPSMAEVGTVVIPLSTLDKSQKGPLFVWIPRCWSSASSAIPPLRRGVKLATPCLLIWEFLQLVAAEAWTLSDDVYAIRTTCTPIEISERGFLPGVGDSITPPVQLPSNSTDIITYTISYLPSVGIESGVICEKCWDDER